MLLHAFCAFGIYGSQTKCWSYGAETGNMMFANLGCKKLKATPSKPPYLLGLRDA
jgi:hypothetical protein